MNHTHRTGINLKFIVRGFLISTPLIVILTVLGLNIIIARTPSGQPPAATPPAPAILSPRGDMPADTVAFQEWVQYGAQNPALTGSGFFLQLDDGTLIGVTSAHSIVLGNPDYPIRRLFFSDANEPGFVVEFETLHGQPGRAATDILSNDYVLLRVEQPVDDRYVLWPDGRGGPQPGERVALFSGLGDGRGGRRILEGTALTVDETAAWILIDEWNWEPALMSGSPVLSQHTGRVVGMVIAATPRNYRLFPRRCQWLIGIHPVGSLVRLAQTAQTFPKFTY